jgi:hypothetical protein
LLFIGRRPRAEKIHAAALFLGRRILYFAREGERTMATQTETAESEIGEDWPRESALILSALETATANHERRRMRRLAYRVKASLRLMTDAEQAQERLLYTRDVNARSLGFLTQHCLPLGYGGVVCIASPGPENKMLSIPCTVLRCREVAPGWFDGALHFNRERDDFTCLETK